MRSISIYYWCPLSLALRATSQEKQIVTLHSQSVVSKGRRWLVGELINNLKNDDKFLLCLVAHFTNKCKIISQHQALNSFADILKVQTYVTTTLLKELTNTQHPQTNISCEKQAPHKDS